MPPNKWDDEGSSGDENKVAHTIAVRAVKTKWEEEEDDDVLDSWDAAADSEEEREKAAKEAARQEKEAAEKKSRAQRIEEHIAANAKAAAEQAAKQNLEDNETPMERRLRLQQMEIENDMKSAESLFSNVKLASGGGGSVSGKGSGFSTPIPKKAGTNNVFGEQVDNDDNADGTAAAATGDVKRKAISVADPTDSSKSIDLSLLPIFSPRTKDEFTKLRAQLSPLITSNKSKAHYPLFVQEFVRSIVKDLSSEQIRKVSGTVTALANEKLKEEKEAERGKKVTKGSKKAQLAMVSKENDRLDTNAYDDYGYDDNDDFM